MTSTTTPPAAARPDERYITPGRSDAVFNRLVGWLVRRGISVAGARRLTVRGRTSGEPEVGAFIALETLCLGVQGKLCLWTALRQVADRYEPLASINLDELIQRAQKQHSALERERMAASRLGPALEG